MKPPTKTSLKRKLDREVSRIVRSRGACAKCRNDKYEKLQAAHIFSRSQMSVRFDLLNLVCLCAGCHFWAHKNPILFTEFIQQYLGETKYQELKTRARSIKKWTLDEMSDLLKTLEGVR